MTTPEIEPHVSDEWRCYYIPLRPEDAWNKLQAGVPVSLETRNLERVVAFATERRQPFEWTIALVDDKNTWIRPNEKGNR